MSTTQRVFRILILGLFLGSSAWGKPSVKPNPLSAVGRAGVNAKRGRTAPVGVGRVKVSRAAPKPPLLGRGIESNRTVRFIFSNKNTGGINSKPRRAPFRGLGATGINVRPSSTRLGRRVASTGINSRPARSSFRGVGAGGINDR